MAQALAHLGQLCDDLRHGPLLRKLLARRIDLPYYYSLGCLRYWVGRSAALKPPRSKRMKRYSWLAVVVALFVTASTFAQQQRKDSPDVRVERDLVYGKGG